MSNLQRKRLRSTSTILIQASCNCELCYNNAKVTFKHQMEIELLVNNFEINALLKNWNII